MAACTFGNSPLPNASGTNAPACAASGAPDADRLCVERHGGDEHDDRAADDERRSGGRGHYSGTSTILMEPSPFFIILRSPFSYSASFMTWVTTPSVGSRPFATPSMTIG